MSEQREGGTVKPRVLNRHGLYTPIPAGAVLVARPSRWGNPYSLTEHSRDEALRLFREYAIQRHADDPSWLAPLRGKNLVCYCAPLPCHAGVLLELANDEPPPVLSHRRGQPASLHSSHE